MKERNTEQKKIILSELEAMGHPTASELYESVHQKYPSIGRATVFRVLAHAAEAGHIKKLFLMDDDARFDYNVPPHAHLHCMQCGKVTDVHNSELMPLLQTKKINNFTVSTTELEFFGVCAECNK